MLKKNYIYGVFSALEIQIRIVLFVFLTLYPDYIASDVWLTDERLNG
jgi:hypothetical protein